MLDTAPKEPVVAIRASGRVRGQRMASVGWRVCAALAAVIICGLLFLVGPGSVEIVARAPVRDGHLAVSAPSWTRPCARERPSSRYPQLAFCARVVGRVLGSATVSGEPHVLLSGAFHFTLVELRPGARVPAFGSRITAVGPLFRGEYGMRELKTLWVSH